MSIPSSVREGARTTNTLAKKRYLIIYFLIITLSAQPTMIWLWYFWNYFPEYNLFFYFLFPFAFFIGIIILIINSIFVSKFFLIFINIIHKPREGIFNRDKSDKDYCYWSLRAVVKKWPCWLARQLNLPILETLVFKVLGVKSNRSNSLNDGWVDCEFIKFGKNVKVGQGSVIMSNIIIKDKLIIKKTLIKDNVIIGAHTCIAPGTVIEPNTIIGANSSTITNQHLEGNSIYNGNPASKMMDNFRIKNKEILEKQLFKQIPESEFDDKDLKMENQALSVPYQAYIFSGWFIVGGSYIVPAFLFIYFIFVFFIPNVFEVQFSYGLLLNPRIIIILLLTPLIITGLYLLHLFFVVLFTRWIYRFADKRGPVQGIFDRDLSESSTMLDYYHFRSFLMKYPVFAIIRSPFPWLLGWELRFIGSNKIGKGTVLEESYIHSHINFGKNCYYGTFAHISNHLVDGVYGAENLTFFGAEIGNGCVFNPLIGGMPGLEIGNNSTFLPKATTIKYDKMGDNGIYTGFPVKKVKKEEIKKFTGGEYDGE